MLLQFKNSWGTLEREESNQERERMRRVEKDGKEKEEGKNVENHIKSSTSNSTNYLKGLGRFKPKHRNSRELKN